MTAADACCCTANVGAEISGLTRVWSSSIIALWLAFGDGHASGIYTYAALRAMTGTDLEDV